MSDMSRTFERRTCRRVDDEELKRLWPSRLPDKELARLLGHHIGTLRRRAYKIGLLSRREIWRSAPIEHPCAPKDSPARETPRRLLPRESALG